MLLELIKKLHDEIALEEAEKRKATLANFDKAAQRVWAEKDVEKKLQILASDIIDKYHAKDKASLHHEKLKRMTKGNEMDRFAADIMQMHHGNKVIK